MVSTASIIGMIITFILTFFLPIIICSLYCIKYKEKKLWQVCILGAIGFFAPQMLIRIPILQLLSQKDFFLEFTINHASLYFFILAFTAALFELAGRLFVAFCMKKNLSYESGIAAGLAHGSMEAVLLVGVTYINNLIYSFMINTGSFDSLYAQMPDEATVNALKQMKETIISTDSLLFYLASIERVLTIIAHITLSLIICYFVWKGKTWIGVILCLFLHTLLDFVGVYITAGSSIAGSNSAYICTYLFMICFVIVSLFIVHKIKLSWKNKVKE